MTGLSNTQQALLMFAALLLPPVGVWAGLGFPMDRLAVGLLVSALISAAIVGIKELMGGSSPPDPALEARKAQLQLQIDALQKQKDALG
jgi:uncharacterized membrane protein YqaE (UPF0057 family)